MVIVFASASTFTSSPLAVSALSALGSAALGAGAWVGAGAGDGDGDWAPARAGATKSAAASAGNVIFLICKPPGFSFRRFGRRLQEQVSGRLARTCRSRRPVGEIALRANGPCHGSACTSRVFFAHPGSGRVPKAYTIKVIRISRSDALMSAGQSSCRFLSVVSIYSATTLQLTLMPHSAPALPPIEPDFFPGDSGSARCAWP